MEATLSVRLLWPFMRTVGSYPGALQLLAAHHVPLLELGNPDTRLPHRTVMQLLRHAVAATGDPTIGLKAAESVGPADLGVIEFAARASADLREAVQAAIGYTMLLNSAALVALEERADIAIFHFHVIDGVVQEPAANDFEMALYHLLAARFLGDRYEMPLEVHLAHHDFSNEREYVRIFGSLPRMDMPHNAIVFRRSLLNCRMPNANPVQHRLFEQYIQASLASQQGSEDWLARVRAVLEGVLAGGGPTQTALARRLGVSTATMRRRLQAHGTTYAQLLADVRRHLAKHYLENTTLSGAEIASRLGYSHPPGFYKAFRRWFDGLSPTGFRERLATSRSAPQLERTPTSRLPP